MVSKIDFIQYKKLKDISIEFNEGLNAISGENGTCKSSLLYLVSNSFQAVKTKCDWVNDENAIKVLSAINTAINPKVESLQRGDQQYNDPAHGVTGTLYTVDYYNHSAIDFRRHNSRTKEKYRYALKPQYKAGSSDTLPFCPVVYLGLSRLVPYGEYGNEDAVTAIKKSIPDSIKESIASNYADFTGYSIDNQSFQNIAEIKRRAEFTSNIDGVDSNTISAGEDNLFIILAALESLKNYYEAIDSRNDIESILLIDEIDATLHPDYQIRLLSLLREYSDLYKIQIMFTTHSLTVLEDMIEHNNHIIYLVNNVDSVAIMEDATIQQIKAHLYRLTEDDIYQDKCIPIFTEDEEARFLIELLFDFYEKTRPEFCRVRRFFKMPDINIGANILKDLFRDEKLIRSHVGAFCILDGDKGGNTSDCVISLPGKGKLDKSKNFSPEELLLDYTQFLYDTNDVFWSEKEVIKKGFSKKYYQDRISKEVKKYKRDLDQGNTTKKPREFNKALMKKNKLFFEYVFKRWMNDERNTKEIETFYKNLKIMFNKCAEIRGINQLEWS